MNSNNEQPTIEAARDELSRYGDAGWLLCNPRIRQSKLGSAIYICDVDSGRSVILETQPDALSRLSEQAAISENSYERIRSASALLIGDLLNSTQGIHPDTRRGVIFGAAFCITETRGFHITRHHGADVQHLLVRYRDVSKGDYRLTPMPVFKTHPIAAAELESTASHILISEQLNFPQRFAAGSIGFRQTRSDVLAAAAVQPRA